MASAARLDIQANARDQATKVLRSTNSALRRVQDELKATGAAETKLGAKVGAATRKLGRFQKHAIRAGDAASRIGRGLRRMRGPMLAAGAAAAGTAAAVGKLTTSYATNADELAKLSRQTGFSVETIQELRFAAARSGISVDVFNKSIEAFQKRLGEARQGTGRLRTLLNQMDADFKQSILTAESTEVAYDRIITRLAQMDDEANRAALASAAFSRAGQRMSRISQNTAAEIRELREQKRQYGTVTKAQAEQAERFENSLENLKASAKGLHIAIGSELVPALQPMIDSLTDWVQKNKEIIAQNAAKAVRDVANTLSNVPWREIAQGIGLAAKGVANLTQEFGNLADAEHIETSQNRTAAFQRGLGDLILTLQGVERHSGETTTELQKQWAKAHSTAGKSVEELKKEARELSTLLDDMFRDVNRIAGAAIKISDERFQKQKEQNTDEEEGEEEGEGAESEKLQAQRQQTQVQRQQTQVQRQQIQALRAASEAKREDASASREQLAFSESASDQIRQQNRATERASEIARRNAEARRRETREAREALELARAETPEQRKLVRLKQREEDIRRRVQEGALSERAAKLRLAAVEERLGRARTRANQEQRQSLTMMEQMEKGTSNVSRSVGRLNQDLGQMTAQLPQIAQGFSKIGEGQSKSAEGAAQAAGAASKATQAFVDGKAEQAAIAGIFHLAQGVAWSFTEPGRAAAHFAGAAIMFSIAGTSAGGKGKKGAGGGGGGGKQGQGMNQGGAPGGQEGQKTETVIVQFGEGAVLGRPQEVAQAVEESKGAISGTGMERRQF